MKIKGIIRSILVFFFASELILTPILFLTYLIFGASNEVFISALTRMVTIVIFLTFLSTFLLYLLIKPLKSIITKINSEQKMINDDINIILSIERKLKYFFIILNMVAYAIGPTISTVRRLFLEGFLRWSTIRFNSFYIFAGAAVGIIQIIFSSYVINKLKLYSNVHEFSIKKIRLRIRSQILLTIFAFTILLSAFFVFLNIASEEKIAGISNVGIRLRKNTGEKANGYFSRLLELSKVSKDKAVKNEAEKLISEWKSYSLKRSFYILFLTVISLLIYLAFVFIYSSNISSHLNNIKTKLKSIVKLEGDITQMLVKTTDNEIGEIQVLFNQLILSINRSFKQFFDVANNVIQKSQNERDNIKYLINLNNEIKESADEVKQELQNQSEVSQGTIVNIKNVLNLIDENMNKITGQSSMIEEISAGITEMNSSIASVSMSTKNANELGRTLDTASKKGGEVTETMQETISDILETSSGINEIVTTISSITEQTDLLAMNAAIEAAHAGESGKGFAVVAEEIRKLAESTADQTKEITELIHNMLSKIDTTVTSSSNMSEAIYNIQNDINSTIQIIEEIDSAAQEQNANSNENMKAVNQLLELTGVIMNNLKDQKIENDKLADSINTMENSVKRIEEVGEKQNGYFRGLKIHFDNFYTFFNSINDELEKLDEKIKTLKIIDNEELEAEDLIEL